MNRLPKSVKALLVSSLIFTIGRAVALPFLAIFLTRQMHLDAQQTGLVLTTSLIAATIFGLYAGYLADRFEKRRLMQTATGAAALATLAMTVSSHPLALVVALATTDGALALYNIALKAAMAEMLNAEDRPRAFSLNYTLINVAYSFGPLLGVAVIGYGTDWPFVGSAAMALLSMQVLRFAGTAVPHRHNAPVPRQNFKATLSALKNDRRLVLFTLGGLLSALAFGRFSVYLSQYLIVSQGIAKAIVTMPYLLMTNAIAVVVLQYPLGKFIRRESLLRWIVIGSAMFVLGLLGFAYATSLTAWIAAMVVFTIGEVIVVPAEYLFIDAIAPETQRGSYYGAQNLTNLGGALNPLLCGVVLMHAAPRALFAVLIVAVVLGALLYRAGSRGLANTVAAVPALV